MPRTCEESLRVHERVSPPALRRAPPPAPPVPDLARLEALLSHYCFWGFHRRKARQYLAERPDEAALQKLLRRLEAFIQGKQQHLDDRTRHTLNRLHAPAYAALYEPPLPD